MAKLYFRYGAMGSSKSANALMTAHNYEEQGRRILLIKPALDTRWNANEITSRAGDLHRTCELLHKDESIKKILERYNSCNSIYKVEVIIVDEAQFLTREQVKELAMVVDDYDIPAICYGLKNSAIDGEFFEGSQALLYWADSIEELKTLCTFCHKKATMNLRMRGNTPVYSGEVVVLGDTASSGKADKNADVYLPVCRHHYYHPGR